MPNKQEWLDAYRQDAPQLSKVSDSDLWEAISSDHGLPVNATEHVTSDLPRLFSSAGTPTNFLKGAQTSAAPLANAVEDLGVPKESLGDYSLLSLKPNTDVASSAVANATPGGALTEGVAKAANAESEVTQNFKVQSLINLLSGKMGTFGMGAIVPPNLDELGAMVDKLKMQNSNGA